MDCIIPRIVLRSSRVSWTFYLLQIFYVLSPFVCVQTCSEAGSETSETSDVSMRSAGSGGSSSTTTTMNSLVNRLHNAQTATTRAKAAEIQVQDITVWIIQM